MQIWGVSEFDLSKWEPKSRGIRGLERNRHLQRKLRFFHAPWLSGLWVPTTYCHVTSSKRGVTACTKVQTQMSFTMSMSYYTLYCICTDRTHSISIKNHQQSQKRPAGQESQRLLPTAAMCQTQHLGFLYLPGRWSRSRCFGLLNLWFWVGSIGSQKSRCQFCAAQVPGGLCAKSWRHQPGALSLSTLQSWGADFKIFQG